MSKKSVTIAIGLAAGFAVAAPASAQVVSFVTFEDQTDGSTINSVLENGNFWFSFAADSAELPVGSSEQPDADSYPDAAPLSTLSGDFSPGFGYLEVEGDAFELPDTGWTIESRVRFNAVGGFQTILGRDRDLLEDRTPLGDFYFQTRSNDTLSCSFVSGIIDNGDGTFTAERPLTESTTVVQAGEWYYVAAVYDPTAQTLNLYVNGDLESSVEALNNIIDVSDPFSQFWSIGRGFYDGNAVDGLNGQVDDLRITQDVLSPIDFLYKAPCEADLDENGALNPDDIVALLTLVEDGCEVFDRTLTYVDADPATNSGPAAAFAAEPLEDDLWGLRAFGTDGTVYEASGVGSGIEDAPEITTTISGLNPSQEYGIYANFYEKPNSTVELWNVQGGLASGDLTTFTSADGGAPLLGEDVEVAERASTFDYTNPPRFDDGGDRILLAGYVGAATADASGQVVVYIDDLPATNGANTRTWYDGVSFGSVPPPPCPADYNGDEAGDFFDVIDYLRDYDEGCVF